MKKTAALLLLTAALPAFAQNFDAEALYEDFCTRCHMKKGYVWERSLKAWQACVYTMQEYAYDEEFTDEVADAIVDYLTENGGRIKRELQGVPEEILAESAEESGAVEPPKPAPSASRRALLGNSAKISGHFGIGALLCAVGSGMARRKLKKRFRTVHRIAATVLLITALFHSAYYLSTFGLPGLLWFQAGVGASALLLATELGGLFRRRLGRIFLKVHTAGAFVGLTATLIHWARIYI